MHAIKVDYHAPYVAEMARREAMDIYGPGAYTDGLKVHTTIDSHLQRRAQEAVIKGLISYDKRKGYRGPEQHWPANFIDASSSDVTDFNNLDLASWQNALANLGTLGGLEPAVVVQVFDKEIRALLKSGDLVDISWENGLKQARLFKTENSRGPRPKTASDVVKVGDVIRLVASEEGSWAFSQVPKAQASLIALNPSDGAIISMVGGFDFAQSHFNRVTQAKRQPGSNFKPFVYTSALEHGMTAASIINDAPIVFEDANLESTWRPENDGGKFYGPTRLRQALYRSRNLVSIRILRNIGIRNAIKGMDRFGFEPGLLPKDLSLALGSYALTPLEIVSGYAVFANGGYKVEPYLLKRIDDVNGEPIFEANPATACPRCEAANLASEEALTQAGEQALDSELDGTDKQPAANEAVLNDELASELATELAALNDPALNGEDTNEALNKEFNEELNKELSALTADTFVAPANPAERVLSPPVAYLINSMLQDVIRKGTGKAAQTLGRDDLAGKTGTTNGPRDAWFSGYNSKLVVTTWLGFDQNLMLGRREYGGSAALPIWIDYMRTALENVPQSKPTQPEGIITVRIDPKTGERAGINTAGAIYESFRIENAPELRQAEGIGNSEGEEALPEELF